MARSTTVPSAFGDGCSCVVPPDVLSLGLAFMQIYRLTETFDERQYSDSASALLGARSPKGGSTFSDAYSNEEAQTAAQRYKSGKHAGYYEKYGLK